MGTDVLLAPETLPPLFALLLEVPLLQVVDDADVVVCFKVDAGLYALVLPPEVRVFGLYFPADLNDEEGVVDEVETFEEEGVLLDDGAQVGLQVITYVEPFFHLHEVDIFEGQFFKFVGGVSDIYLTVVLAALKVVRAYDLVSTAT